MKTQKTQFSTKMTIFFSWFKNFFSLSWLHGVLNPVIYSFLSYGYRNRLKKLWARVRDLVSCFIPCYAVRGISSEYYYSRNEFMNTHLIEAPYPRSATQTKGMSNL